MSPSKRSPRMAGGPAGDVDPGPPIPELAELSDSPSPRFVQDVLDGVNRRQASSQMVEVVWWGWTSLVLEMMQGLFKALRIHDETEKRN